MLYYGADLDGFQLPFNFHLINAPWHARGIADFIDHYEAMIPEGGWPNWVLGNHDRDRIATRVGNGQARVAKMLLLTLRGTPTMWQGDELGMLNEAVPDHMLQDPWAINNPGTGIGRDPVRVPLPWDDTNGRGFTSGEPFLPLSTVPSVAEQQDDPNSMLTFVRALIALRRAESALSIGSYVRIHTDNAVLAYAREADGKRLAVALNFTDTAQPLPVQGTARLSTIFDRDLTDVADLRPDEGVILDL